MGIIARQSFKSSIVNYLGIAVGYLTVIWLFPKFLTQDEFGLTRVFLSLSVVLGEFGRLGLPFIVVRFFPFYKTEDRAHYGFLRFILFLTTIGALLLTLFLLLGKELVLQMYSGPDAAFLERFYAYLIPITIGTVYAEVLFAYSRSLLRAVVPAFAKEMLGRSVQLIAIGLFALGYLDFKQFLVVFASSILIQPLFVIAYLIAMGQFRWRASFKELSDAPIGGMMGYGFVMILNKVPGVMLNQLDVIMLSALAGLEEAGIYAVAYFLAELIRVPTRNMLQIATPVIASAWKRDDLREIESIYKQASLNLSLIGSAIFILIIGNFSSIQALLQEGYRDVFWVVFFVGLSKVIDSVAGLNGGILFTSKAYRFSLVVNLTLLILAIITNFIFIPIYGIVGAALATAVSILFVNVLSVTYLYWKYKIHPFTTDTLLVIGLAALSGACAVVVPDFDLILWDAILNSTIMVVILGGGIYLFGIHKRLQFNLITSFLSGLLRKRTK